MKTHGRGWVCVRIGVLLTLVAGCQTSQQERAGSSPAQDPWGRTGAGKKASSDANLAAEPALAPRTHLAAGRLHESQNQLNRAVEQYRAALTLAPDLLEAQNRMGVCLTRLGQYTLAEEHFKAAIALQPEAAYLRNNLGFCYISQHRWQDAEAELRNALQLKPEFARARINLGLVMAQQRRFDEARECFAAVLNEADVEFNLGLMHQSVGQYGKADRSFRDALRKNPKLVAAREKLKQLAPLLEREEREAVEQIRANAGASSRPARGMAGAVPPAQVPTTRRAAEGTQQASAVPTGRPSLVPIAGRALASLRDTLTRAQALGAEAGGAGLSVASSATRRSMVMRCLAVTAIQVPNDLDEQDSLWLAKMDPRDAARTAECLDMAGRSDGTESVKLPFVVELTTRDPDTQVRVLDEPESDGLWFVTGRMTSLPVDPFLAFPVR